jgi:YebC/PmpR family DNA-binding regulatory protein
MAGHSKWNNIKNRKGAQDKKRGAAFSQCAKLIKIAVKEGGSGDPKSNSSLRLAIDKARAVNMPKDKIAKSIDRGLGKTASGVSLKEAIYEGFASGGVGLVIVAVTENTNRTSADVKFVLSRNGGTLGSPGSVSYMFKRENGEYKVQMPMQIDDEKQQEKLEELFDALRELEDVEDVDCAGVWEDKQ